MKKIQVDSLSNKTNILWTIWEDGSSYYEWYESYEKFTACFDRIYRTLAQEATQISRSSNLSRAIESWNESQ